MATDDAPIADWLHAGTSDPGEVGDRYNAWATAYDDDLTAWSYQAPAVVADILVSGQPDAASVLDIGCGTGMVGKALRDRGFAGRIRGLDISESSLEHARDTGAYDSVEQADLQQPLPLEDDSTDALVCVGVMTYLPEIDDVWREFARVTVPGGLVVLTQREDLWHARDCQAVVDRLLREGILTSADVTGPAPYLPKGYGGGEKVDCYYVAARAG